ncbi:DUF732 domain-containing protein [Agromyces albus]|uniref:DUF732 domain-containing protein n=1 Tax=Agromyces albus TaxID=205332 RepID=UPI0027864A6A|nr:DUF732 domain-containing protein [Agromyces albus]MDQ0576451.1 hypothetical protein [Agromyces albus]
MKRLLPITTLAASLLVVVFALTGCAAAGESVESAARSAAVAEDETPTATEEVVDLASKTNPGEVCDPHNLNDVICAAFYPDLAVINMTSAPRGMEPLASLPEADRIALAHQACDALTAGATKDTLVLVDTIRESENDPRDNNRVLFSAGTLAYCNEHLEDTDAGYRLGWIINAYRQMGEAAAKESFADGTVIQPPERPEQ